MKTAIFNSKYDVSIVNQSIPKPKSHEILVRVKSSAICTWEQRVYTGIKEVDFPFVGGHEISGEIVEIGSDIENKNFKIGDKVVFGIFLSCGNCDDCKAGHHNICAHLDHNRKLPDSEYYGMGGFSEFIVAKPEHLFKYEEMSSDHASLIEPVSCCIHSIERANIEFGDNVLIIGCGIMGLIHLQLALKKGAVVYVSDFSEDRLKLASELGAHQVFNPNKVRIEEKISIQTSGKMMDVIFNTTAIPKVSHDAMSYLGIRGTQVLYSSMYPSDSVHINVDTIHKREQKLIGTSNSNAIDFIKAIKLVEHKIIDLNPLVSEVYNFEDIKDAMESAIKGDKYRVVLRMNSE